MASGRKNLEESNKLKAKDKELLNNLVTYFAQKAAGLKNAKSEISIGLTPSSIQDYLYYTSDLNKFNQILANFLTTQFTGSETSKQLVKLLIKNVLTCLVHLSHFKVIAERNKILNVLKDTIAKLDVINNNDLYLLLDDKVIGKEIKDILLTRQLLNDELTASNLALEHSKDMIANYKQAQSEEMAKLKENLNTILRQTSAKHDKYLSEKNQIQKSLRDLTEKKASTLEKIDFLNIEASQLEKQAKSTKKVLSNLKTLKDQALDLDLKIIAEYNRLGLKAQAHFHSFTLQDELRGELASLEQDSLKLKDIAENAVYYTTYEETYYATCGYNGGGDDCIYCDYHGSHEATREVQISNPDSKARKKAAQDLEIVNSKIKENNERQVLLTNKLLKVEYKTDTKINATLTDLIAKSDKSSKILETLKNIIHMLQDTDIASLIKNTSFFDKLALLYCQMENEDKPALLKLIVSTQPDPEGIILFHKQLKTHDSKLSDNLIYEIIRCDYELELKSGEISHNLFFALALASISSDLALKKLILNLALDIPLAPSSDRSIFEKEVSEINNLVSASIGSTVLKGIIIDCLNRVRRLSVAPENKLAFFWYSISVADIPVKFKKLIPENRAAWAQEFLELLQPSAPLDEVAESIEEKRDVVKSATQKSKTEQSDKKEEVKEKTEDSGLIDLSIFPSVPKNNLFSNLYKAVPVIWKMKT